MHKRILLYFALLFWWVVPVGAQLTFSLPDLQVNPGDEMEIDLTVENFRDITTVQFSFRWDPTVLEFIDILDTNLVNTSGLVVNTDDAQTQGYFALAWFDNALIGETLTDGDYFLKMKFRAIGANGSQSDLEISDDPTPFLAGDAQSTGPIDTERNNGTVSVGEPNSILTHESGRLQLHPNQPNPFRDQTLIQFDLTESEYITFSVYDLAGQKVLQQQGRYPAGPQYITLEQHQLPAPGTYLYQIQAEHYLLTQKMTLVR
ncbi:MAG: cohesin domain-containing protein [Bacteroidota bacterium]|mgnify:CR=1 FL=1